MYKNFTSQIFYLTKFSLVKVLLFELTSEIAKILPKAKMFCYMVYYAVMIISMDGQVTRNVIISGG